MTCLTCKFREYRQCKRFPPVPVFIGREQISMIHPEVHDTNFCGEYQAKTPQEVKKAKK